MRTDLKALRPQLGHAARVAVVATAVIALVYAVTVVVADAFLFRRVIWEVDSRLNGQLSTAARLADPRTAVLAPDDQGTDGAPVLLWWVPDQGSARPISAGGPPLPIAGRAALLTPPGEPVTISGSRYESTAVHGGRVVAGQNLSGPSRVDGVLVTAELITVPVLLAAVFLGVVVIALEALEPVERARRRQLEFTADASHELRTPLTVIEAEVELALTDPSVERSGATEALERVSTESRRLRRIVDDLLWLARFDTVPPDLDERDGRPADLAVVTAACAARFEAVARTRKQRLTVTVLRPPGVLTVDAPASWLDRLLGTLLDNACRYVPEGGTVRVSAALRAGRVVLTVEDDGPGIAEPDRAELFERFRRSTTTGSGAGLGLAIADSVVRGSKGKWRVAVSPLGGALMEVSWRRAAILREPSPDAELDGPAPTPEGRRGAEGRERRSYLVASSATGNDWRPPTLGGDGPRSPVVPGDGSDAGGGG